jgi:hypothetical protein
VGLGAVRHRAEGSTVNARMAGWTPQAGDPCVELMLGARGLPDVAHEETAVLRITETMVITRSGARYHLDTLAPVSEGPRSAHVLTVPWDERVLCARGRATIARLAQTSANLRDLDRRGHQHVIDHMTDIIEQATSARSAYTRTVLDALSQKEAHAR